MQGISRKVIFNLKFLHLKAGKNETLLFFLVKPTPEKAKAIWYIITAMFKDEANTCIHTVT